MGLAQEQPAKKAWLKDKTLIAIPVVFRFPETGWGWGAAATSTWRWAKDAEWAKPSQASLGLTFTQKKQVLAFLPFQVFLDNNRYYLNADIGWFKYNFFYYGIGENAVPQERYEVKFPRIRLLAVRQLGGSKNLYAGFRVNYEEYSVYGQEPAGELAQGDIEGSEYSRTSAIGPALFYDSRDAVFYPRKGIFGELNFLSSLKGLGADRNFSQLSLDVSGYKSLGKDWVLAGNLYTVNSFGRATPFSQLGMLGGPKKMRGVYQGFFRDKNVALLQSELRWEIWQIIGMNFFGNLGFLGNENDFLRLEHPKFTYGLGLRIATKNHLNLRLDYGFSPYGKGNFYATVGEAF